MGHKRRKKELWKVNEIEHKDKNTKKEGEHCKV